MPPPAGGGIWEGGRCAVFSYFLGLKVRVRKALIAMGLDDGP